MRNFDYLREIEPLRDLSIYCEAAEAECRSKYDVAALNCRRALEWLVKTLYQLKNIELPERASLYELMTGAPFIEFISDDRMMMAAHYIRKVGNLGVHNGKTTRKEAFFCVLNLYNFVGGVLLKLGVLQTLAKFDESLLPESAPFHVAPAAEVKPQISTALRSAVAQENLATVHPVQVCDDYTEAETRRLFIDLMLKDAGWDVLDVKGQIMPSKACIEVEVSGMPNEHGVGYVDYVLFGANGKPLAVVEAKRTMKDPAIGKHQAELYADCLEAQYGVRPVIYYTNGFQTFIIDGLGYPARPLYAFHTEEDLDLIIKHRSRGSITDFRVNDDITNRDYQKMAIHSICDHFNKMHRRGLLVMATGTGKTRVSISLVDVLSRNDWVKNVLFLADRTSLVNQAHKNFVKHLPTFTTTILNESKEPDLNARIVFSTYQTMINYIDKEDKRFSVGRFDLVIIDEAHRSVFGKYVAILDYFDALMVGLTATPREDVDRSTYDLFGLEGGEPNFAYELGQAVDEDYLVPPTWFSKSTKIMKEGIRYEDLSDEEKKQMEDVWKYEMAKGTLLLDEKATPVRDITSSEIFNYIFNIDTVDKVLTHLMTCGQMVDGGEKIGKTIIFAYNHEHAQLIVQRFAHLYPEYGSDFCVLIDNQVTYSQNLIDNFSVPAKMPQIAVSVDMLDTGIDVPEILNLVFFKKVKSKIKFWQMVGRGTRKCEDIFGEGVDKQFFFIFDWCGNIEYFSQTPNGSDPIPTQSLTERLFDLRVDLAAVLQHATYQADAFAKGLHDELKDILWSQVKELNFESISVRKVGEIVDKFQKKENWTYISSIDAIDLKEKVAPILVRHLADNAALRFDILVLNIQLSLVDEEVKGTKSKNKVCQIAQSLQEKASIPQVAAKLPLINKVADPANMKNITLDRLEFIRNEMRDLVQFIFSEKGKKFTLNISDIVEDDGTAVGPQLTVSYRQRVMDWLKTNRDLPVLKKLFSLEQLTHADIIQLETICWRDLGTKEEYQAYVRGCKMLCGDIVAAFIRSIIGIDREKASQRYADFLTDTALNPDQEEYLKTIISYVCENGDITSNDLINVEPFSGYDWLGVFGPQAQGVGRFVGYLHNVIVA